jgi:hypothetical protein
MLISAQQDAPRAVARATFTGRAKIDGAEVVRPCRLASMSWPIPDAWGEFPHPRLLADVSVSVSGVDFAPITIAREGGNVVEAKVGEKITLPLVHTRRSEFSGAKMQLNTMGAGFERVPQFDLPLTADSSQAVLDLAALKTPPGEYLIAFYGSAVAKYRHHPEAVLAAEEVHRQAEQEVARLDAEVKQLSGEADAAPPEKKEEAQQAVAAAMARHKAAVAALADAAAKLKNATAVAQPKDIVDIVVSEPITIRVQPAEAK